MPSRESESLVLRTYPLRESDLIVSFFTRDRGKLRGVARGARHPKSKFGVALERLSCSRLFYMQKENRDLVNLRRAELTGPSNLWKADYPTSIILDVIAEAADRLLPENEPNDHYFRLLLLVAEEFRKGIDLGGANDPVPPWAHRALVYFLLWTARLGGWLPPLNRCSETDRAFEPDEPVFFGADRDGLFGARLRNRNSWPFPREARDLASAMLRNRVDRLGDGVWQPAFGLALQHYLLQRTQAQLEGNLRGLDALRELWREAN